MIKDIAFPLLITNRNRLKLNCRYVTVLTKSMPYKIQEKTLANFRSTLLLGDIFRKFTSRYSFGLVNIYCFMVM